MSSFTTTQKLAQRAGGGDGDALEELARRTYPGLRAAARTQLRRRAPALRGQLDSEDLTQSCYREALRALPSFEPRPKQGAFRAWLAGVLKNKLRRRIQYLLAKRRHAGRLRPLDVEPEDARADGRGAAGGAASALLALERREALERGLRALSERHRRVLELRFFEGLPWRDVGQALDLAEPAAQMLCHRALQALRAALGPGAIIESI